jgi:hypothetical protein
MVNLERRIEALEKHAEASDEVHKELLEKLHNKDVSDALIRQQLDTLVITTNRIDAKLDKQHEQIEQQEKDQLAKPAKKWETVVTTIITAIASGLAGVLVTLLFK